MLRHLYLSVLLLAVCAAASAQPDIQVVCGEDSVSITWKIHAELVPLADRLFLGNCKVSQLDALPNGDALAKFNYRTSDCKFKKQMKGKFIVYKNELTYRPRPKPEAPAFTYPFECIQKRSHTWVPPFLNPASGVSASRGNFVFHMALLNEDLTGIAKSNVIPLGSFMPIWAAVDQRSHQPLLLLMEECVAATTPELVPGNSVYPIINNKGCLLESVRGNAMFLPRYHSSAITVQLQSFKFHVGEEVYIHCKLIVWDPEVFDETKKACHYSKESERWELLDDPLQSSICNCCDSSCGQRLKRAAPALRHNSVLGPLIIVDPSDSSGEDTAAAAASELMRITVIAGADLTVDCGPEAASVVWTDRRPEVDVSLFRLGGCFPTSVSAQQVVFSVAFTDCNFRRMVTGDHLVYSGDLSYSSSPGSIIQPFTHRVECSYERPQDWYPMIYEPVFQTYAFGDLVFHMSLMNRDFSGPAESSRFSLGSFIPILASVEQRSHQPLLLLLEECVASATAELQPDGLLYPVITNKGCLVDSRMSLSKFLPRDDPSKLYLSLQAFRFAAGEQVFLHCKLVAADPDGLDVTKKACHYVHEQGWELLDNVNFSHLCDCCESTCQSRWRRTTETGTWTSRPVLLPGLSNLKNRNLFHSVQVILLSFS
ncbi:zona pellucida glycoprotein 3f, tandem duplicate 2 isoform X1 [Synchiropus splendidus]|uniref:zona pellucida glycoprotein 3f, tandem duplicate 2 isoform X1 n=1 Tax=Synchiropus splendidus TaxID=270530 RepID=UPI00237E9E6D|nr:zona pellucida glycoprotein 3f, tandem duplicate 2 isoform X1 [Synchiropus splendidus]